MEEKKQAKWGKRFQYRKALRKALVKEGRNFILLHFLIMDSKI